MPKIGPEYSCLNCGRGLDAAGLTTDDTTTPGPNDITVCIYCGHLMAFASDMSFRPLTREEELEVAGDPSLIEVMRFREAFTKTKASRK